VPFFDHYIAMDESDIKDYVTRFSGLRQGDLDPLKSSHWLTSSKRMYEKLRFLVDCGTKFIGHGLHTDFRIMNIWVPSTAIIDTVSLFHIPGQRFLSLKFLAKCLLSKSIQNSNVHCSVEDARTAMELYRVWKKLKTQGDEVLEGVIKGLYDTGRAQGWK
jgi:PAB-dependent poly(A)-specific ribonuclease subunit 2